MRRAIVACGVAFVLLGAADTAEPPRTAEAQAKLDKYLGGRVAGERRTCLPVSKTNAPIGIDDHTLLFRDGPRIWRNDVTRSFECGSLNKQSTVVSESTAGRLCNGDKFVFSNGATAAACELGDFVLYQKP